eukprot:TRINITY_DN909_c0_g1_i1.p3 TRINITY_DN909_c0_g1~~TRINITY_DN909_c0_g1_i1.p3  ORF type:complete len:120 (+),score=19.82 TRINITY_DN909_c0_g1_i1:300-659(+)
MDFSDSLLTLTFSEESKKTLTSFHMEHRATTRAILAERQPDLPHYTDLEWKLEVQLASRCLRQQAQPRFVLKLGTDGTAPQSFLLQADVANLRHLGTELEDALKELRKAHARRIMRNIK